MHQPRKTTGHFDTNGATPHEKSRWYTQQAHITRVTAAIARYNGENSQAETLEAQAADMQRLAASHLATALTTSLE